jgi:hypothetical protein
MAMTDCQHEWAEDQSGGERMFVCLACGQRLDAGPLSALILRAEQGLGAPLDPTPLAVIEGADMPLSWTTETPAVPGWFWFEDSGLDIGPQIVMWTGSAYSMVGREGTFIPSDQSRWAGPLEPPLV